MVRVPTPEEEDAKRPHRVRYVLGRVGELPRGTGMSMSSSGSHTTLRRREMDSNPRSRFTYSPFRTPSCRLRDGPVRQNGKHPFATGYRAFEARFRRRVYRATAWGLSAGALPTSPRMGRSPPIGLRDAAGDVVRTRDDRPTASRNSSKSNTGTDRSLTGLEARGER